MVNRPSVLILGAGQLAQMLVEAATGLPVDVTVWAGPGDEPASRIASRVFRGDANDEAVARKALSSHSLLLFESEFFPTATLERLAPLFPQCRWVPDAAALNVLRDKAQQKRLADQLKIPTAPWRALGNAAVDAFLDRCQQEFADGFVLKASRGGYDGRGLCFSDEPREKCREFLQKAGDVYAEAKVKFRSEAALVATRGFDGSFVAYPLFAIDNAGGICRWVYGPTEAAGLTEQQHRVAELSLRWIAEAVNYVGTIAAEFFVADDGSLLLNEVAPRVHNSGHVTRSAAMVSQFDNHWRAALQWKLGSTAMAPAFAMRNIIGPDAIHLEASDCPAPKPPAVGASYWYGKGARPGRKLGHLDAVDFRGGSVAELASALSAAEAEWLKALEATKKGQGA